MSEPKHRRFQQLPRRLRQIAPIAKMKRLCRQRLSSARIKAPLRLAVIDKIKIDSKASSSIFQRLENNLTFSVFAHSTRLAGEASNPPPSLHVCKYSARSKSLFVYFSS
jgi:hypothetical protein